jgi:hypothetical protein
MCLTYDSFDIIEVAEKCGIHFHPQQRNDMEFKALCPFCGDTKYHLGLNRKKERFNCFRCKEYGNSVSLYAKLHGISNKEAHAILKSELETLKTKELHFRVEEEIPLRPIEDRHDVYYDFLSLLRLNRAHQQNLEKRGLSYGHIHQFMYRSIPTDNVFRREVLETLASRHNLVGIPGFWYDEHGDIQMYYKKIGGIYIPVCDKDGYIQGLQMRLDVLPGSDEKKFRWFSSKHFQNGTGAKPWIHIVGDTTANEACLTEGALKADVTSVLSTGKLFIAVPGVNAIAFLPDVLRELGITKVYEAFDMDKRSKLEVKQALISLRAALNGTGVECVSCSWNPNYKGLDDYILAKSMYMQQNLVAA